MAAAPVREEPEAADPEAEEEEEELASSGVAASLLVGWAMVCIYLASAVLQVYEREALSSTFLYPDSSQFAFLRELFPSPAASDLIAWQSIVLFQVVPLLLFFHLAVRMRIAMSGKLWPTIVTAGVVGAALSVLSSLLEDYQVNISHLLLTGSFAVPAFAQSGSEIISSPSVIASILWPPWIILENGAIFSALALTGLAFGSFAGETPYGIFRRAFDSFMKGQDEDAADAECELGNADVSVARMFTNDVGIKGSGAPAGHHVPELMPDVLSGKLDVSAIFTMTVPLSEIAEGYRAMDGRTATQVLVKP